MVVQCALTAVQEMLALKILRNLVVARLFITLMKTVHDSLTKFSARRIGESHSMKRAADMSFPSLVLVPRYNDDYIISKISGTKNLTEYYLNRETISDKILMMQQSYETVNG